MSDRVTAARSFLGELNCKEFVRRIEESESCKEFVRRIEGV